MKQDCWWKAMLIGAGVTAVGAVAVTFGGPLCAKAYKDAQDMIKPYVPTEQDVIRKLMSENTAAPVVPSKATVYAYDA